MPEITIHIGGRDFEVVCKAGEEPFLQSAAVMLDTEATALTSSMGRIPENRMLLMAGLMLADKTASLEDQLSAAGRTKEAGPLTQDVPEELAKLKDDLKTASADLKTSKKQLADKDQELTDINENLTAAMDAMERMVVSLEEKGAA